MAARPFGTVSRRLKVSRLMGLTMLLGTTAIVTMPRAEAAGEIVDPSRPDNVYYHIPAVSGDGTIFVGSAYDIPNRIFTGYYEAAGGVTRLPSFGGDSRIYGMSGDGRYVVGYSRNGASYSRAFLWDAPNGDFIDLGLLYPSIPNAHSIARDISGDGRRVVGTYSRPGITRAFAWIKDATTGEVDNEQMYRLNSLDDANNWGANAISDDGRYVVGYSDGNATSSLAVRWDISGLEAGGTGSDVILNLGSLTGENGYSGATDISANGQVVVGRAADADGIMRAFRWVEGATGGVAGNVQMYDLGTLALSRSDAESEANAVSRDGAYVVGWSGTDEEEVSLAFRWTEEGGMESVEDWLARNGVTVAAGQSLTDATAISDNGQVVAGVMTMPDWSSRAFIARVSADEPGPGPGPGPDPDPGPGPGPGPGTGIMDVEEYQRSLFSTTQVAHAGEFLTWLPMNGAHHRPLMQQASLSEGHCMWATGDFGVHGASGTGLGLAEAGACVDLLGGSVKAGLGVGTSHSWQTLALGGSSRLSGQYVIGEVDWQPDGTPLLLSLTGMLGGWNADIHRGYSNGAATAYSDGKTGLGAGVIRLRADWLGAAQIGNTSINPWVSVAAGRQHIAAFTETGGSFPAHFDAQTLGMAEVRLGVAAVTELSAQTTLTTSFEVVHRGGNAPAAKGNVIGLFDFSLGGGTQSATWLRAGLDLDHQIADNVALSGSVHAATNGRDPSISGSVGLKLTF